jgi:hypothetical protein
MKEADYTSALIAMTACFALASVALRRIQLKASDTELPQEISAAAEFSMLSLYFVGVVVVAVLTSEVLPQWVVRPTIELWMWLYVYPVVAMTKAVLRVHKP